MQFLTDVLIGILSTYLVLTNTLADHIHSLFEVSPPAYEAHEPVQVEAETPLSTLDSEYTEKETLPSILIENAAYQGATAIDAWDTVDAAETITDAVVNILCTYETSEYERTSSGSGFFISREGVILTNAHVAQFLLLEGLSGGTSTCAIRSIASDLEVYEAELLYISPSWVERHAHLIDSERPRGTGERDFALLYVTKGSENKPLPARFPYLPINTNLQSKARIGSVVTVAGFPAETYFTSGMTSALLPQSATSTITDMFTFNTNYADVIAIASSSAGEHGISGGPIVDEQGDVIGLITTKGGLEEGPNSLRALTLSYIDRTITTESTFDLRATASGQLAFRARLFMDTIVPFLSRRLQLELE